MTSVISFLLHSSPLPSLQPKVQIAWLKEWPLDKNQNQNWYMMFSLFPAPPLFFCKYSSNSCITSLHFYSTVICKDDVQSTFYPEYPPHWSPSAAHKFITGVTQHNQAKSWRDSIHFAKWQYAIWFLLILVVFSPCWACKADPTLGLLLIQYVAQTWKTKHQARLVVWMHPKVISLDLSCLPVFPWGARFISVHNLTLLCSFFLTELMFSMSFLP